jgi:NADP-dependent 3-hydroxy acid dehydrogenase YdfG
MVIAWSSGIGLDVAKKLIVKGYRMVSNFRNITERPSNPSGSREKR